MSSSVGITTKICNKCHQEKNLTDDFYTSTSGTKYGRRNTCKSCDSKIRLSKNISKKSGFKICNKCNKKKSTDNFNRDKSKPDGCDNQCNECQKKVKTEYKSTLNGYMRTLFGSIKRRAKKNGILVEISLNDLFDLYEQQKGLCALTGISMSHTHQNPDVVECHVKNMYNISVDRIDSDKNYVNDNIQLVCYIINNMKWDISNDKFVEVAKKVTEAQAQNEKKELKN